MTASPEPGGGERSQPDSGESGQEPAGDPVFLAALTPKGTAPIKGRQRIDGRWYEHSLAYPSGCGVGTSDTVYAIGEGHGRFQATVGVTGGRSDSSVTFTVFADVNDNEFGDGSEELGVAAAVPGRSATLDVPLDGATRIILRSHASSCSEGKPVWADPRVF